ncbi:MAG TPA: alpha-ketoglutarate-dependent dioxygenase AlkB [Burkholderiales bacterium]|nr:alpha-ketoglutarate-dependent dioxygenase AlkB [Burkholderiales bacterium]
MTPKGLVYELEFLSPEEERALVEHIKGLPLEEAKYKAYTARRRTVSYGYEYDFDHLKMHPAPPMPTFLSQLKEKVGDQTGISADAFVHALVTEYRPGVELGWHRDVPEFEVVVGISLAGPARMRFRPYPPKKGQKTFALDLEPRSMYILRDEIRWGWQHSVSPTPALRYSITFRTRR